MVYGLILFCILLFLILLGILAFLLIRKAVDNLMERKKESYRQFIYPKLSQYVSRGDHSFHRLFNPRLKWKREVVIDILDQIAASIKSEEEFRQIQHLCLEIGLISYLAANLDSSHWWAATSATRKVQRFKLQELIPHLTRNLHSSEYYLWTASARALSKMNQNRLLVKFLMENHSQLKEWSIIRIGDILTHGEEDDIDIFLEHLEPAPPILRKLFLQILGKRKAAKALPAIEFYLDSNQKEFILTALQAIVEIRITSKPDQIVQLLSNPEWEIRMWAVRAVQACGMLQEMPTLVDLLSDTSWWVRLRCAEALYSFGSSGIAYLQKVVNDHQDGFARDMAFKVLQDQGFEVKIS